MLNRSDPVNFHRDRHERDSGAPFVFMFVAMPRSDRPLRYRLLHGDVVVWAGRESDGQEDAIVQKWNCYHFGNMVR